MTCPVAADPVQLNYMSVAKDQPSRKRFAEMAGLSRGVAGLSFLVGLALRIFLGVEI